MARGDEIAKRKKADEPTNEFCGLVRAENGEVSRDGLPTFAPG